MQTLNQPSSRYPGTRPFSEAEQALFFGREEEAEYLRKLILLERLIIFNGKSGYGKSSLLNARVLPCLREKGQYTNIVIRFYGLSGNDSPSPVDTFRQTLLYEAGMQDSDIKDLNDFAAILLNIRKKTKRDRFLLVFDQVEEIFDYHPKEVEKFGEIISDLFYQTSGITGTAQKLPIHQLKIHTLFSIRSDRLSYLNRLTPYLPDIFKQIFELQPLSREQAIEAIVTPAMYSRQDFTFECPKFYYNDQALQMILDFLTDTGKLPIEAFQLQIICNYLEKKIIADPGAFVNSEGHLEVQPKHLQKLPGVIKNFYLRLLEEVAQPADLLALRRMVEEGLIINERRLTVDSEVLKSRYNISQKHLDDLEDRHLLRRERNSSGGISYEIAHDAFLKPILAIRQKRELEERIKKEKEELEIEKENLKEAARKATAKRMRAIIISTLFGIIAVVMAILSYNLREEKQQSVELNKTLEKEKYKQDSLGRILKENYSRLLASQVRELVKEGNDILLTTLTPERYYPQALAKYREAYQLDTTNYRLKMQIDSIQLLMDQNQ